MALDRSAIRAVDLPEETVAVESIGGEVTVRGMDMPQMLRFLAARRRLSTPLDGESADIASERAGGELVPMALASGVLAGDGLPVYTDAQWRVFGARHPGDAIDLFNRVMALSGEDTRAEKKT